MSSILNVTNTLNLLQELRGSIRNFSESDARAKSEFDSQREALEKRTAATTAAEKKDLEDKIAAENQRYSESKARLTARHQLRRQRISQANASTKRSALSRIENEEGRRKYNVQKGTLDTERWSTDALSRNDQALAKVQSEISSELGAIATLETRLGQSFRGYHLLKNLLKSPPPAETQNSTENEQQLIDSARKSIAEIDTSVRRFSRKPLPALFRIAPLWIWFVLAIIIAFVAVPLLQQFGISTLDVRTARLYGAILFGAALFLYLIGYFTARSEARSLVQRLTNAKAQLNHAWELASQHHQAEAARIKTETHDRIHTLNQEWEAALADAARRREELPSALEQKQNRVSVRNDQGLNRSLQLIETSHEKIISELKTHSQDRLRKLEDSSRETWQNVEKKFSHANEELVALSRDRLAPPADLLRKMAAESEFLNPPWDSPFYTNWNPPPAFVPQIRFAWLDLNLANFSGTSASEKALGLPAEFSVPLSLSIPDQGSLLIESPAEGKDQAIAALNNLMLRILSASPLGKVAFTIFDPVNLGQNFAGITHLADFEPNLIDGRIWTQPEQFEERLSELNEHMEKVIQMYLRNEYSDIAAYNKAAGNIAEKYHFLVMADFPVNLSESASRKLLRIISSGARCGVYTLMHWDPRQVAPPEFLVEELQRHSIILKFQNGQFTLAHPSGPTGRLRLDQPPAPAIANKLLTRIGEMSRGSNQVKVPFTQVAPGDQAIWSLDTSEELRVPIGRSGANKLQYLSLGRGTRQHALVAGKTGSGKSTLFHVLITNLALWASPDQVEFYLIDFKKGVEFRAYAAQSLPHARVVAIESDREFGLSVLHRLDDELRRRGEIFRKANAQDLTGFRRTHPNEPMPRTLLIIDEFQEFFVEEDRISQTAAMLLDRIVRQGRAFGIHVILGSQTLGGAFTLARSTIGQMVIRIALQCNEADAYLIMDESNPAPRLLSRPGEGIYNDMAGAIEGNSPFQTVWLPEPERADRLRQIHTIAESRGVQTRPPIVFEGNAPAEIRGNAPLAEALDAPAFPAPAEFRFWLGAPNAIKGPTEAVFRNRSGSNLIMVGQNEEATLSLLLHGVIAFRAQFPNDGAQWLHFSAASPNSIESQRLQTVLANLPNPPALLYPGDIDKTLAHLLTRLEVLSSPSGEDGGPSGKDSGEGYVDPVLLVIHGLQNFKRLRVEDEFAFNTDPDSPASAPATLQRLITEGPNHGIHIIVTLDNFNNVSRFIGRKLLAEFEMRVLFQMSANDSVSLCDSPKANLLGLHRAILYNEHEGTLETFRPYSMPDPGWLETVRQKLSAKAVPQDS